MYKRQRWKRKENHYCRLHNRKWSSSWCSLDIFSRLEVTKRKAGNIIRGDCSYHRKSKGNRAKNVPSTSTTQSTKRKSKANEPLAKSKKVKKATDTKNPLNSQNNDVDGNEQSPGNEDAGIIEEFDYHDSMDAENYQKYFEKICKLLKPNSLIIIDNASYHSRNSDDFPKSKWKKAQFEQWLKENKVNFPSDSLRSELWVLCKTHRNEKNAKVVKKIAKKYGMEVLRLPPYHCELNAIRAHMG